MSEELNGPRPSDRSRIDVFEDSELQYWSERFGVDKTDLQNAIETVGPVLSDIEAYFNKTLDIRAFNERSA